MSTSAITPQGIPAILTGQALRALRDAGYSLPTAIGEVIDNSIEAKANDIAVYLEDGLDEKGKAHIQRIAIADDGSGMGQDPEGQDTLHHYLQLGYSTRYMSETTLGKYGVGAKLAAFNFAERIDVWSCSDEAEGWRHVSFDLTVAERQEMDGKAVEIAEPDVKPFPEDLGHLMPEGTGTLVLWSKIDRLKSGRIDPDPDLVRVELDKELSRIFREFIDGGIAISVNDNRLMPHDPLFLMEGTWGDKRLSDHEKKQAENEKTEGTPRKPPQHYGAEVIADEPVKVGGSKARLRVTLYPEAVTRKRGRGGDALAKALRVPENEGSISFVRLDREISYTNVPRILPSGVRPSDRFIGIEVRFTPELDAFFGVRHVKRGVEPHGELRDQIRQRLSRYIPVARERLEQRWGKVAQAEQEHVGEHAAIVEAVNAANRTLPKGRVKSGGAGEDQRRALAELAEDVGKQGEEKESYVESLRENPFVIESVSFPGQTFIDVQHFSDQVLIRLNTRHRFYRELWEPIREIAGQDPGNVSGHDAVRTARRTLEALALLVVAYGKAESMDENPAEDYTDLRNYWGQFLDTLLGKVKDVI